MESANAPLPTGVMTMNVEVRDKEVVIRDGKGRVSLNPQEIMDLILDLHGVRVELELRHLLKKRVGARWEDRIPKGTRVGKPRRGRVIV